MKAIELDNEHTYRFPPGEHPLEIKALRRRVSRSPEKFCLLCRQNKASKKNSHIFPIFFTKSIFLNPAKRKIYITNYTDFAPVSNTPKEDYILCPECEIKLGALERLVSLGFPSILQLIRNPATFNFIRPQDYSGFWNLGFNTEPALMHLLVYSMLWRAHVSSELGFSDFALEEEHAEKLRETLVECLSTKKIIMIEAMKRLYHDKLPMYYVVMTCYNQPKFGYQRIHAQGCKYASDLGYQLIANEFVIKCYAAAEHSFYQEEKGIDYQACILLLGSAEWEKRLDDVKAAEILMNKNRSEKGPMIRDRRFRSRKDS